MSKLEINLESPSHFLRDHINFEIRDGSMKLVDRVRASEYRDIQLSPGLYQVSAVLQDGENYVRLVEMNKDRTLTFRLDAKGGEDHDMAYSTVENTAGASGIRNVVASAPQFKSVGGSSFAAPIPKSSIELEKVIDARVHEKHEKEEEWFFEPTAEEAIPWALFRVDGSTYRVSLPTNPLSAYPYNACSVVFKDSRPYCWMSPQRVVGNTLQHWLLNGQISKAADIAKESTDLLRQKYKDPTAAVLGALILFRFDRLEDRRQWVKNLAGSFPWLTDAQILDTVLEAGEVGPSLPLLEAAIEYASRPILFTGVLFYFDKPVASLAWPERSKAPTSTSADSLLSKRFPSKQ